MVVAPINYLISWFLDIIYHLPAYTFKSRIKEINQRCLSKKNGEQMYQYLAIEPPILIGINCVLYEVCVYADIDIDSDKSYFAKAISNLIINKNRTRSFKCYIF